MLQENENVIRKTTVKAGYYLFHPEVCTCKFGVMDFSFATLFEGQLKCKCGEFSGSKGIWCLVKNKGWWFVISPNYKQGDITLGQRTMKQGVAQIERQMKGKVK